MSSPGQLDRSVAVRRVRFARPAVERARRSAGAGPSTWTSSNPPARAASTTRSGGGTSPPGKIFVDMKWTKRRNAERLARLAQRDRVQQHHAVRPAGSRGSARRTRRTCRGRSARRRRWRRCGRPSGRTSPSPRAGTRRPASPARAARQYACWLRLSVRPMTSTSYCSCARSAVAPQPQPMSSSRMPGLAARLAEREVDLRELRLGQRRVRRGRTSRTSRSSTRRGTARRTRRTGRSGPARTRNRRRESGCPVSPSEARALGEA